MTHRDDYHRDQPATILKSDSAIARWYLSKELWVSNLFLLGALGPLVASLESANWVDSAPSLFIPLFVFWTISLILSFSKLSDAKIWGLAIVISFSFSVLISAYSIDLSETLLQSETERLQETILRLIEWVEAIFIGGVSTDPLPFVFLINVLIGLITFFSVWSLFRLCNPWLILVPSGFAILTNISYLPGQPIFAFVIFLFGAILLIIRTHYLKAQINWRVKGINQPEYLFPEILVIGLIMASVLIVTSWVIPTANKWQPLTDRLDVLLSPVASQAEDLGRLFLGVGGKKSAGAHSFGRFHPIDSHLILSEDLLLEIRTGQPQLLRGASYDLYTGLGWALSDFAIADFDKLGLAAAEFGTLGTRAERRESAIVELWVTSPNLPSKRLLAPGEPLATDRVSKMVLGPAYSAIAVVPDRALVVGDSYLVAGATSMATSASLNGANKEVPVSIRTAYTQLPEKLDPRIFDLALRVTRGSNTSYEAARRIEEYLRYQYQYSLVPGRVDPQSDIVAEFLFESGFGHFDHFSSAMTVMLRTLEIPARVSVGFVVDETNFNPETKSYEVTGESSWSWPQVYFSEFGWIDFNPTPVRPVILRADQSGMSSSINETLIESRSGNSDFLYDDSELLDLFDESQFSAEDIFPENTSRFYNSQIFRVISSFFIIGSVGVISLIFAMSLWWSVKFREFDRGVIYWRKIEYLLLIANLLPPRPTTPSDITKLLDSVGVEFMVSDRFSRAGSSLIYSETDPAKASLDMSQMESDYLAIRNIVVRHRVVAVFKKMIRIIRIPRLEL